ncbi:MAG: hypothetical protein KJ799_01745 [Bacteroidetes bacterium]|nr:hypothetical protein [Bacteroidota bacterium]
MKKKLFITLLLMTLSAASTYSQYIVDKNKGNNNNTKKGFMDGNLVGTVYYNFGEVGDYLNEKNRSGVWPKGTDHIYLDGVAIIVQAEAFDPQGKKIHPLETNYYEFTRYDPSNGITYGWWALPNYANPYNSSPARSDDEFTGQSTWPNHWPDRTNDWDGYWNGFFGKGVKNADLETYFVFDDDMDREYIKKNNFYPDEDDLTRGGLGMQVKTRGFQWSHILAADVIFWYYEITNMGTYDYDKALFAQYVDWGIGGANDNSGDFDALNDISFAWSLQPLGTPGNWGPVGLAGYAFLESPGIADDGKDNDSDGLTDENRNNEPNMFIDNPSTDPFIIDAARDTVQFKKFYNYSWNPHWDADENANWRNYFDANNNGKYDEGDLLNDDVGTDGIGPFDKGYSGEDSDGTEGNGRPDQGEPNFGILDKDESDQLGLTGFLIYAVHDYELRNDEQNWKVLSSLPTPQGQPLIGVNLANSFSSYLFHMNGRNTYSVITGKTEETGETERFSMALIFAINRDDLIRRKQTVQKIYNAHYRFAKPPDKPIVTAVAGDKKVTLIWDDRSEKTFDAFYQRYNFEGYKVYRSTEPNFLENKIITDAFGKPIYISPIAQFDVNDGIKGLHPIDVNGALFYLGSDSGLRHSFIDSTVQNGQTYYYAVTAYDKGFTSISVEGIFQGISPAETSTIIRKDINGNITTDINTAVVTPNAPSLGYIPPEIKNFYASGPGTGNISLQILNPDSVKNDHLYRIEFKDNAKFHNDGSAVFSLIDHTENDTLFKNISLDGSSAQTQVRDGLAVLISADTATSIDEEKSSWISGNSNYIVQLGYDERFVPAYKSRLVDYPADFEIELTEKDMGDLSLPVSTFTSPLQSNILIRNITEDLDHIEFIFRDENKDAIFNSDDAVFIAFGDSLGKRAGSYAKAKLGWSITFIKDTTLSEDEQIPPQSGDVFKIVTKKPFRNGEYFEFTSSSQKLNKQIASSEMEKISVVPNPYTGASSWEPDNVETGRGERRISFINLPAVCTIRIYTIAGKHLKTLDHNSNIKDGSEIWNLISKDGMDISFGIYIYHVDAPGFGEKIGRFAIIK